MFLPSAVFFGEQIPPRYSSRVMFFVSAAAQILNVALALRVCAADLVPGQLAGCGDGVDVDGVPLEGDVVEYGSYGVEEDGGVREVE